MELTLNKASQLTGTYNIYCDESGLESDEKHTKSMDKLRKNCRRVDTITL